jgi:hypothetical protein
MGNTALEDLTSRPLSIGLSDELSDLVDQLRPQVREPAQWQAFYRFVVSAYRTPKEERPGVSQLSRKLQALGNDEAARLAVLYAHGLYILALSDDCEIYGDNFNP